MSPYVFNLMGLAKWKFIHFSKQLKIFRLDQGWDSNATATEGLTS